MRAYLMVRDQPHYRRDAFARGLARLGFAVEAQPRGGVAPEDVLVIWNRYGHYAQIADRAERQGATVLVAENGLLGRDRPDGKWYSLAVGLPAAGGGRLPEPLPGEDRTRTIGAELGELRRNDGEVIVLEQRGIGPPGIASPPGWTDRAVALARASTKRPVRVRRHPGEGPRIPIKEDLKHCHCVVTWASSAALVALALGVPVFYQLPTWIGRAAGKPFTGGAGELEFPKLDEQARAATFRNVGLSTWRTDEIETGEPLARLLALRSSTRSTGIRAVG